MRVVEGASVGRGAAQCPADPQSTDQGEPAERTSAVVGSRRPRYRAGKASARSQPITHANADRTSIPCRRVPKSWGLLLRLAPQPRPCPTSTTSTSIAISTSCSESCRIGCRNGSTGYERRAPGGCEYRSASSLFAAASSGFCRCWVSGCCPSDWFCCRWMCPSSSVQWRERSTGSIGYGRSAEIGRRPSRELAANQSPGNVVA